MKNWPRKRKLTLALLILLISLFFIFTIPEWPSPTPEIALRRMEKQRLIGPSEIIAKLDMSPGFYEHLWIGETDFGYITFEFNDSFSYEKDSQFLYFPKTGDITLFCIRNTYYYSLENLERGDRLLPIFLFPKKRAASSAEMKISFTDINWLPDSYHLTGEKMEGGYYLFSLPVNELRSEYLKLFLQTFTDGYKEYELTGTVEIHVNFYDSQGNLVDTYSKTVSK